MIARSTHTRGLEVVPVCLREANEFVAEFHRHHGKVRGQKFSIAVAKSGSVRGVVIVGRPVSRCLDDGWTLEALRCCSDGTKNVCSCLYAAAWRAARAMGYARLITYTLPAEGGASLRAAGWKIVGESKGGTWSRGERPRVDCHPLQHKLRWQAA
jgi:hypothetical protein